MKRYLLTLLICFIILVSFTWLDVPISILLYQEESAFSNFIHQYGHVPSYFVFFLALLILLKYVILRQREFKRLLLVGLIIAIMGAVTLFLYTVWSYFERPEWTLVSLTIGMLTLSLILTIKFPDRDRRYREYATVYVVTFFVVFAIVALVKFFWMRERFMFVEDVSEIPYWFQTLGGIGTDRRYTSMPSGHMKSGAVMLIFIIAATELKEHLIIRFSITTVLSLWLFLVALGRIIGGYHYASDVLISFMLVVLSMGLVRRYLNPIVNFLKRHLRRIIEDVLPELTNDS